jgi:hypothetical protein
MVDVVSVVTVVCAKTKIKVGGLIATPRLNGPPVMAAMQTQDDRWAGGGVATPRLNGPPVMAAMQTQDDRWAGGVDCQCW